MIKRIITTLYFMYVIFMTSFGEVYSAEWDCASSTNTGTFTRSTGCMIYTSHVAVSNTLAINGTNTDMNNLITISAYSRKRHFYLNDANAKLILRYLKLIGGDVSSYRYNPDKLGGSICIFSNGGELNLYSSIVFNNKAKYGGGIYAHGGSNTNKNTIVNIYNSIIQNNKANCLGGGTCSGGGIYIAYGAVATIETTTIDNNQVSGSYNNGGGMVIVSSNVVSSDVTMRYTIISNNDASGASSRGGGFYINGASTYILSKCSDFDRRKSGLYFQYTINS